MPRYYFDTVDGTDLADEEGLELHDYSEARDAALDWIRKEALADPASGQFHDLEVHVRDAAGAEVFSASLQLKIRDLN